MYSRRRAAVLVLLLICLFTFTWHVGNPDYNYYSSIKNLARVYKSDSDLYSDQIKDEDLLAELRSRPEPPPWKAVFQPGEVKPKGYEHTRGIVMARIKAENATWVDSELGDLLKPKGPFEKFIYVADDRKAPLHTVKNKGHEAMIYLTYIIDHYDNLPDVSIFIHSHRFTWHNSPMMDDDLAAMVRYLRPEKIVRDGYMNLRCRDWPGCPDWLHLSEDAKLNDTKKEEQAISQKWKELFPLDDMPPSLSQPCCAQFAVSRERIRAIPKQRFMFLRTWLSRTELDDYISGRVFEYTWQYIFTGNPVLCPSKSACYCEGFGICFRNELDAERWDKLYDRKLHLKKKLKRLEEAHSTVENKNSDTKEGDMIPTNMSFETLRTLGKLRYQIGNLEIRLKDLRDAAFMRGR